MCQVWLRMKIQRTLQTIHLFDIWLSQLFKTWSGWYTRWWKANNGRICVQARWYSSILSTVLCFHNCLIPQFKKPSLRNIRKWLWDFQYGISMEEKQAWFAITQRYLASLAHVSSIDPPTPFWFISSLLAEFTQFFAILLSLNKIVFSRVGDP